MTLVSADPSRRVRFGMNFAQCRITISSLVWPSCFETHPICSLLWSASVAKVCRVWYIVL